MNTTPAGKVWRTCAKCRGTGHLGMYGHVAGGTCFDCDGRGRYLAPADWQQREVRAAARREREAAKRTASSAADRLWAEFASAHPDEAALIEAHKDEALGYAYSAVATYDPRDSNPDEALHMARDFATTTTAPKETR